jgi:ketosteroid isomerase-like protein
MNHFKPITLLFSALLVFAGCSNQNSNTDTSVEPDLSKEKEEVIDVMKSYKDAIQNLTTEGTLALFTEDATVFESGGSEGTYTNYVDHHLGPELDYFDRFEFSDYNIDIEIDMPYAFTTESYIYTIDIKPNEEKEIEARTISKKGVATSILKKTDGQWKIIQTHSSSRNNKAH